MVGCATHARDYSPSVDNVMTLKKNNMATSNVSFITVAASGEGGTSLKLRANTMVSPIGNNFGDYIANSLRQELELAKLFDPKSGTIIYGELLRNEVDASSFSAGVGQIEVRFFAKRDGQVRFNKVIRIGHQWESSFAAAVAIPNAKKAYPEMVQKLITVLITDADFVNALKN